MKFEKKIKAFTLAEILVVIVISAIVAGLALAVLNMVQQNFISIRQNLQNSTDMAQLEQQLSIDFNRFHEITYHNTTDEIRFKNPLDSVVYKVHDGIVIREQDTLRLDVNSLSYYFDGGEVENGKVDAVKIFFNDLNIYLFVYKINSAKTYLTGNGN